jgi:uncharacterized protein
LKALRTLFPLVCLLLAFVAVDANADANANASIPPLTARVVDETGTLSREQRSSLEATLKDFESSKGAQISVLMVPTTQPETIEQYSMRVVEQWKLGRKRVDDGAMLIVAKNDRALRIEVGYGLEGALNDATSNRIIQETVVPRFKEGDFYGGVKAGLDSMMSVVSGEPLPAPSRRAGETDGVTGLLPALLVIAVVAGGVLRAMFGRLAGSIVTGGVVGAIAWLFSGAILLAVIAGGIALVFTLAGSGIGAFAGGRYLGGGSGGFGGRSNRDVFRGGGGGFGGGGASGRW